MHESYGKFFVSILILASVLCGSAFGDENSDARGESGDSLQGYLPSGCYHAGQYRQEKTVAGLEQPLVTAGNFLYTCDQGLIWHTAMPVTETIIYKISGEHFVLNAENHLNPLDGRVHKALGTLLNHLIGGNLDYLKRHFQTVDANDKLRLLPKQKRLKNFLQYIEIVPSADNVQINLQHSADETTRISIFATRVFESFDVDSCKVLLPEKAFACGALFL